MLKLIKNKVLPILLIFTLVFTTMIFTGTPIKAYASEKGTSTIGFVNPLYEDLLSEDVKARYLDGDFEIAKTYKARSLDSFNPDIYVTDIEDAADVLRKQNSVLSAAKLILPRYCGFSLNFSASCSS